MRRDHWDPPCDPHGKCDVTTGTCICDPGWVGESCDEQVEKPWDAVSGRPDGGGSAPGGCTDELCAPHGICDEASGKCECDKGWTGVTCSDRVDDTVQEDKDGAVTEDWDEDFRRSRTKAGCTDQMCAPHGWCDEASGECVCREGWTGETCSIRPPTVAPEVRKEEEGWPWWWWLLLLLLLICCCCCCGCCTPVAASAAGSASAA